MRSHKSRVIPKTLLEAMNGDKDKLDALMIELGKGKDRHGLILKNGKIMRFIARDKWARQITILEEKTQ